jgi:hypothetical protein
MRTTGGRCVAPGRKSAMPPLRVSSILLLAVLTASSVFAAADREASRAAVMIPVAGTVPGAFGTRFQTDLTIATQGHHPAPVHIDVYWLPQNEPGSTAPAARLTLQPRAIEFYEDFVTRTLGKTGLGSILLRAVNADGTPDLAARIDAFARVWTPVPEGAGTTSQAVHASTLYSPPVDDFQPVPGVIYGLRQDAAFRSNFGIVNMSDKTMTFTVSFLSPGSQTRQERLPVEARSMIHQPVPAGTFSALTITVTPDQETPPTLNIGAWTAYGSSIDNRTGDAWYSKAQAAYPHNER